jgi:zinc transporter ZupT
MLLYPIFLALILSILHYYSSIVSRKIERYHYWILSLSSGILLAIIFLELFPEAFKLLEEKLFLFVFLGFTSFHLLEKFLYQHIKDKKLLLKELAELHVLGFFIDHFILGFLLVLAFKLNTLFSSFIFIPIALHTISSSLALEHIHEATSKSIKIILSASTFIGAILASALNPSSKIFSYSFSFIIGIILYIAIRDMLPKGKKGNQLAFIIGIIITLLALTITKQITLF